MIVAVLGANGFVGTHLARKLQSEGITIQKYERDKGFDECMKGARVAVNLIGRFLPPFEEQYSANILATLEACQAAAQEGVGKIVHISAAAAYGSAKKRPFTEDDVLTPDTTYGLTKKIGEEIVQYFSRVHNISYVILRPTNIYGSGSTAGAVPSMLHSIQNTGAVTITGDGKQSRDFVHVSDVVRALFLAVTTNVSNQILNIASGEHVSLNSLVKLLEDIIGRHIPVQREPEAKQFVRHLAAANDKAKNVLGWRPSITLAQGLRELIEFHEL